MVSGPRPKNFTPLCMFFVFNGKGTVNTLCKRAATIRSGDESLGAKLQNIKTDLLLNGYTEKTPNKII